MIEITVSFDPFLLHWRGFQIDADDSWRSRPKAVNRIASYKLNNFRILKIIKMQIFEFLLRQRTTVTILRSMEWADIWLMHFILDRGSVETHILMQTNHGHLMKLHIVVRRLHRFWWRMLVESHQHLIAKTLDRNGFRRNPKLWSQKLGPKFYSIQNSQISFHFVPSFIT